MQCIAQDKLFTNNGDTLDCRISIRPWKEKIRTSNHGDREQNGYNYIVAFFSNDSVRIILPYEIKGFYVHEDKMYLNQGYYSSQTIHLKANIRFKVRYKREPQQVFLREVFIGRHIAAYEYHEDDECLFLFRRPGENAFTHLYNKKDIEAFFNNSPALLASEAFTKFRFRFNQYVALAKGYEKLRAAEEN